MHLSHRLRGGGSAVTFLLLSAGMLILPVPTAPGQEPQNKAREYERAGTNALEQKNYAVAERQFRLAVKLEPSSASAHSGLGIALRENGRPGEAVREFQNAVTF